ncbi:MAG: hypothetical protein K8T26_02555 [Lentisphaerae bacterium]|nr:hypothetical protein [Lentisphaerota bacterium]
MNPDLERNLGQQPLADLLTKLELKPHALVAASTELITHKMVARACKGRRLTPNVQGKILRALNAATGHTYTLADLFTYQ